ncbi:MAG: hypothetical protein K0S23_2194 [Fluviicola sp.]|jgi:hypothetical protein|uniref:hypothetical protein n=1 Tax=Fluviicola sp. TaxID=1917219 RepID=UPI002608F12F|nr:hypothetical protein [Fluviicola sp.]MDF3027887.1 hypothetical protein [Fluviicola sp.]
MRILLFIIACWCFGAGFAQTKHVYWAEDSVRIGDKARLTILIKNKPAGFDYNPISDIFICEVIHKGETLWKPGGELEIESFRDTNYTQKGVKYWKGVYTLIAWDSAKYRLPDLWMTWKDSAFSFRAPNLYVGFVKKKVKEGIDEIPIEPENDYWILLKKYWWVLVLLVAAVVIAILWNKRRKIQKTEELSLRERTLLAIQQLRKKEDWLHGKTKSHYVGFSAILKMYLSSRYELNLMERTTHETISLLKLKGLDFNMIKRIETLLREADMVKFAKMELDDMHIRSSMFRLEEIVTELSPLEIPE